MTSTDRITGAHVTQLRICPNPDAPAAVGTHRRRYGAHTSGTTARSARRGRPARPAGERWWAGRTTTSRSHTRHAVATHRPGPLVNVWVEDARSESDGRRLERVVGGEVHKDDENASCVVRMLCGSSRQGNRRGTTRRDVSQCANSHNATATNNGGGTPTWRVAPSYGAAASAEGREVRCPRRFGAWRRRDRFRRNKTRQHHHEERPRGSFAAPNAGRAHSGCSA